MANTTLRSYAHRQLPQNYLPSWLLKEFTNIEQGILGSAAAGLVTYAIYPGEFGVVDQRYPLGDIRRYGAPMDGVHDDGFAILVAFMNVLNLSAGTLILPWGDIRILSNLDLEITDVVPREVTVKGYGQNTRLRFGPLVTVGVTLTAGPNNDFTNGLTLKNVVLDMDETTGAPGVWMGRTLSARIRLENVQVWRAHGVGACAFRVAEVVQPTLYNVVGGRCTDGLVSEGTSADLPTVVNIEGNSTFYLNDRNGIRVTNGFMVTLFPGTTLQSNEAEGLYCAPTSGANNADIVCDRVWLEDNCRSAGTYELLMDASLGGTGTLKIKVNDTRFNTSRPSIFLKGVANYVLDNNLPYNNPASIRIESKGALTGTSAGTFVAWDINAGDFATVVSLDADSTALMKGPIA